MIAAVGMTCLGFFLGYLSMYFVVRFKEHTVAGLSGVVAVLLGGVVGQFLTDHTGARKDTIWWYPIGLVIGLFVWGGLRILGGTVPALAAARVALASRLPMRGH